MKRRLVKSPAFQRGVRRLIKTQPDMMERLAAILARLEADAFDPRLRTHKLKGRAMGTYSCSVAYDMRILFDLVEEGEGESILLLAVGTHDQVY